MRLDDVVWTRHGFAYQRAWIVHDGVSFWLFRDNILKTLHMRKHNDARASSNIFDQDLILLMLAGAHQHPSELPTR